MLRKIGQLFTSLVILGILFVSLTGAVLAEGTGPDDAMAATGEWTTLQKGETHWYVFRDEGDGAQIDIEFYVEPNNSATFEVWTPEQRQLWAHDQKFDPVGQGTKNSAIEADLSWEGNFSTSGNYYVVVKHKGMEPSQYRLVIRGKDVSFPTLAVAKRAPAAAPQPPTTQPMAVVMGVDGQWRTLNMGETHWYSLTYGGDNETLQIAVEEEVMGRVNFALWTPDLYARKMKGEDVDPVGRGSENPCVQAGDLNWTGDFNFGGTFYISVEHTCQPGPGTYVLSVTGAN
jgi:hypothetical protein